jgi:AraC-like DNA-binding protein
VRYQLRLRLVRALAELPHRDDLAALAYELGFSSHSHFTTAFRTTLGMTPSQYRRQVRIPAIQRT